MQCFDDVNTLVSFGLWQSAVQMLSDKICGIFSMTCLCIPYSLRKRFTLEFVQDRTRIRKINCETVQSRFEEINIPVKIKHTEIPCTDFSVYFLHTFFPRTVRNVLVSVCQQSSEPFEVQIVLNRASSSEQFSRIRIRLGSQHFTIVFISYLFKRDTSNLSCAQSYIFIEQPASHTKIKSNINRIAHVKSSFEHDICAGSTHSRALAASMRSCGEAVGKVLDYFKLNLSFWRLVI